MAPTNSSLLTRSHAVYSAKKREKKAQIQEVVFDDDARREYLTGFRKRNLLKKENKRKNAIERERLEKLELRKQHRQEVAERAAKNVREVEGALGMIPADTADISFMTEDEKKEDELEFEDEEQIAVVTVVEDFDADTLRHPEPQQQSLESPSSEEMGAARMRTSKLQEKTPPLKKAKDKVRAHKIRYETKAVRKVEKFKQRARRTEKAERAGGKKKRGGKR